VSWETRETPDGVGIGDGQDQVKQAGGLLATVKDVDGDNGTFRVYEFVQRDGTSQAVYGSSAIDSRLSVADIGLFVKLTFKGRAKSKRGREFKEIDVAVWTDELTDGMKAWPRLEELQRNGTAVASLDDHPDALNKDDDDLPF